MPDALIDFHRRSIMELLTAPIRNAGRFIGRQPKASMVREVDRYIIEAGIRPLVLSELCQHFDIHERTMHRAFHEVHGIGPIAFMHHNRLCDVHETLRRGGPGLTVRGVAIAFGFVELGRFAAQYRHLFGARTRQPR